MRRLRHVNQSGAAQAALSGASFRCGVVIPASTELSGEIFALQDSLYAVSKFELGRPSERGENGWEHFL